MSVNVRVNGSVFVVPSGAAIDAVYALVKDRKGLGKVRDFLSGQRLDERPADYERYGYVDFDNLERGKPKIVGDFYRDTTVGRLLSEGK